MSIDANHLQLSLSGRPILHDVSLHLEPGQIYGLLGPNGAGKSSTIAVLLGLYRADAGNLRLFGEAAHDGPASMRRRIGVLPEQAGFYDWMSAPAYLDWYAGLFGEAGGPVGDLLQQVGLGEAMQIPIGQFSRGMRQRLALARALVQAPELLILDEPTNGLDPRGRREIHDLLLGLARGQGTAVLLCTHLLDDVDRLCERIGILHQGYSVLEGKLSDLVAAEGVGQGFRLRLSSVPESGTLPEGIILGPREGDWWHLTISAGCRTPLPDLWEALLAGGWRFTEIQALVGGLEALYLRMTRETDALCQADAA